MIMIRRTTPITPMMIIILTFAHHCFLFNLPACCSNCEAPCWRASAWNIDGQTVINWGTSGQVDVIIITHPLVEFWQLLVALQHLLHVHPHNADHLIDLGLCLLEAFVSGRGWGLAAVPKKNKGPKEMRFKGRSRRFWSIMYSRVVWAVHGDHCRVWIRTGEDLSGKISRFLCWANFWTRFWSQFDNSTMRS